MSAQGVVVSGSGAVVKLIGCSVDVKGNGTAQTAAAVVVSDGGRADVDVDTKATVNDQPVQLPPTQTAAPLSPKTKAALAVQAARAAAAATYRERTAAVAVTAKRQRVDDAAAPAKLPKPTWMSDDDHALYGHLHRVEVGMTGKIKQTFAYDAKVGSGSMWKLTDAELKAKPFVPTCWINHRLCDALEVSGSPSKPLRVRVGSDIWYVDIRQNGRATKTGYIIDSKEWVFV